jgi:excisionase family DNA binding protein
MEVIAKFMNLGQAAQNLGVSAASLRAWSDQGAVPVYRTPGGQRRFSTDDLDDFTRSMRQPRTAIDGRAGSHAPPLRQSAPVSTAS